MSTPDTAPSWQSHRGKKAAHTRWHGNTDTRTQRAAEDFAESRWDAKIRKLVDEAPPLSPEQRDQLAVLLRSPGNEHGGAA